MGSGTHPNFTRMPSRRHRRSPTHHQVPVTGKRQMGSGTRQSCTRAQRCHHQRLPFTRLRRIRRSVRGERACRPERSGRLPAHGGQLPQDRRLPQSGPEGRRRCVSAPPSSTSHNADHRSPAQAGSRTEGRTVAAGHLGPVFKPLRPTSLAEPRPEKALGSSETILGPLKSIASTGRGAFDPCKCHHRQRGP
jgi:hypothetical protein